MSKKILFLINIFLLYSFTFFSHAQNILSSTARQQNGANASGQIACQQNGASVSGQIVRQQSVHQESEPDAEDLTASELLRCFASRNDVVNAEDLTASEPTASEQTSSESESFVGKNIFSFDLGYLRTALKNNGWGIGLSYEQSLFYFFSIKGLFSHVTIFPQNLDFNLTTVGIGAELMFYPFGNGLDKLYLGFGNETDFFMYLLDSTENSNQDAKDTIIMIYPKIGWKQNFFNLLFLDVFLSYNFFLTEVPTFGTDINLLERGINYGAKFKFNLSEIWILLKNKFFS